MLYSTLLYFLFIYYFIHSINDLIKFVYHSSKHAKLLCDEIFMKSLE